MEEMDLSKEIDKILLNSNYSKVIKSGEEVKRLSKKTFLGILTHSFGTFDFVFEGIPIEDVLMGFSLSGGCVVFSKNQFCISNGKTFERNYKVLPIEDFEKLIIKRNDTSSDGVFLNDERVGYFHRQSIYPWNEISDIIKSSILPYFFKKLKEEKQNSPEKNNSKSSLLIKTKVKNIFGSENVIELYDNRIVYINELLGDCVVYFDVDKYPLNEFSNMKI